MRIHLWLAMILAMVPLTPALAVVETDEWEREFQFNADSAPKVFVRNVWGEIKVRPHDGDSVIVRVSERRLAADEEQLARLDRHIWLETEHDPSGLSLVVGNDDERSRWRSDCRRCELHLQFDIQVPRDARVDVGTVMDGAVRIQGLAGPVAAHNVNGDVRVEGVHHCGDFDTVNGELSVDFDRQPSGECRFETVNGDMTVRLPDGGGARVLLDLFNGNIRSDFEVEGIATEATIESQESGAGTRYRISQAMGLKVGRGGAEFHFESINGDVLIRRR